MINHLTKLKKKWFHDSNYLGHSQIHMFLSMPKAGGHDFCNFQAKIAPNTSLLLLFTTGYARRYLYSTLSGY
jgi:hypothetical protein